MQTISKGQIESDYQRLAEFSHFLLEERTIYRFVQKWSVILNNYCETSNIPLIKIQASIDKDKHEAYLKVTQKASVNTYSIDENGIEEFAKNNKQWLDDISLWYDLSVDDLQLLFEELKHLQNVKATDTVVALGDPQIGIEEI